MCDNGITRCKMDHCSYFNKFNDRYIILLLYVDDMLIAGSSMVKITAAARRRQRHWSSNINDCQGEEGRVLEMWSLIRDHPDAAIIASVSKQGSRPS